MIFWRKLKSIECHPWQS